jgi:hypothetical protein
VFQDRQALMGLYGYMQNRQRVDAIAKGAMGNTDASQRNFDLLSSQPGYKVQMALQNKEMAQQSALDRLTPTIGMLADKVSGLMVQYPGYTTAITVATAALVGLASSAATLALLNGGKLGAGLGAGRMLGALGTGARFAGGVGLAGAAGYGAGALLYKGLEGNAGGNLLGRGVANVASFFGSKEAADALRREEQFDRATAPRSIGDRLGSATGPLPLLQQDLKGEIFVRVTGAPGLNVETETRTSNPRIPFRAQVGQSMMGAGY